MFLLCFAHWLVLKFLRKLIASAYFRMSIDHITGRVYMLHFMFFGTFGIIYHVSSVFSNVSVLRGIPAIVSGLIIVIASL